MLKLLNGAVKNDAGLKYRKMKPRDVASALQIVEDFDEDDAEEASYALSGDLSNFFVVEAQGAVAGFTGYSRIPDAPTSAWLSWTYVEENFRRQGVGAFMLEQLRFSLAKTKVERLFISTSDYEEDGVDIYAEARRFYQRHGAQQELVIPDFYALGEARFIYRLSLESAAFAPPSNDDGADVAFVGVDLIPETQSSFALLWREGAPESPDDLQAYVEEARTEGAHFVCASMPGPLAGAAAARLADAGLRKLGDVSDYYGAGVHDSYFGLSFSDERRW